MDERNQMLVPEGQPPHPSDMAGIDLPTMERWWEQRWKRYAENRFSVIMSLWLRTRDEQPVDEMEMKQQYTNAYNRQAPTKERQAANSGESSPIGDLRPDDLGLHVNAVRGLLGVRISEDACTKLLAEMDQQRAGAVDGQVDRQEAELWWSQYSDDESLLEEAWDAVEPDFELVCEILTDKLDYWILFVNYKMVRFFSNLTLWRKWPMSCRSQFI